jgi:Flp pilus assembly CpaF family ATPase
VSDELEINPNADKGREPKLVTGRSGTRLYSINALTEKIVAQFEQEHGNSPLAQPRTEKLKLLRDVVNYVLAVESVIVSPEEQVELTRKAYTDLFSYGALDALFADPNITTISLEGIEKVAVRYGHGDLVSLPPLFDDVEQFRRVIDRLLEDAGASLRDDIAYIESGLTIQGRPISLNLVLPPATIQITADIRVHPKDLPQLESMIEPEQARTLLTAIAQSPHGFIVVGESESGKTTLLSILANLSGQSGVISVERAGELRLPEGTVQLKVQWETEDQPGITFGGQIAAALQKSPACIILDEVRADEPEAITPLLTYDQPLRQMWAFRGPHDSKRLSSALGMVARRGDASRSETLVQELYKRLPFVIVMRRRKESLQLLSISEWQFPLNADYPDYVELARQGWDGIELTGKRPTHDLALPYDFWG